MSECNRFTHPLYASTLRIRLYASALRICSLPGGAFQFASDFKHQTLRIRLTASAKPEQLDLNVCATVAIVVVNVGAGGVVIVVVNV